MPLPLHLIDAFADGPFTGNPAAVVLLDGPRPDAWMRSVAAEMNQAETAFLRQQGEGYSLRWFTPVDEVDLCGHATLASAHFLREEGHLAAHASATFQTRSGRLTAHFAHDGMITLDFPAITSTPLATPPTLHAALGVVPREVLRGDFDILCVLHHEGEVRTLTPDLAAIARLDARGVLVTAEGSGEYDFVSRCFFPALGVPEDSATGSAHCALASYWRDVLGKEEFTAFQASPRGAVLRCAVAGDRVHLSGRATTVLRGTLLA